jgi:hypothetical protein
LRELVRKCVRARKLFGSHVQAGGIHRNGPTDNQGAAGASPIVAKTLPQRMKRGPRSAGKLRCMALSPVLLWQAAAGMRALRTELIEGCVPRPAREDP